MAELLEHAQIIPHGKVLYDFAVFQAKAVNVLHLSQIGERCAPNADDVLQDRANILILLAEIHEVLAEKIVNSIELAFVP